MKSDELDACVSTRVILGHEVGWECPACHLTRGEDGYDPCLGHLPGVKYACCGHGGLTNDVDGYIYFENGRIVRFEKATMVYHHEEGG